MATCSVPDCDLPVYGRGFCNKHWSRLKRNGHLNLLADPNKRCAVKGCDGKHLAKGMCRKHYLRHYRTGSLNVKVARGRSAVERIAAKCIRNDRGCLVYTGKLTKKGYAHVRADCGKMRFAHVIMYERENGPVPAGLELDHKCRNRACCNPSHLEAVTHQENIQRAVVHHEWGYARLPKKDRQKQSRRAAKTRWRKESTDDQAQDDLPLMRLRERPARCVGRMGFREAGVGAAERVR